MWARGGGADAMSLVKNVLSCISLKCASGCVKVRVTNMDLELSFVEAFAYMW